MLQSKIHNSKSKIIFSFLLPSAFFVVFLLAALCHAQTEIEGEVSGVWTAEDSPYIVTDSTWVPEDSMLTIEAGVTVRFDEGVRLDVFGLISVEGTEEDSVFFTSVHDTVLWRGIYVHKESEFQYFEYLSLNNADDGLLLGDRGYISLKHTQILTLNSPIYGFESGRSVYTWIEIEDCQIVGGRVIRRLLYPRFNAKRSLLKSGEGINLSGGTGDLDSCIVYGSYGSEMQGDISYCTFYNVNDSTVSQVHMIGNIYHSTFEGDLWALLILDGQGIISNVTISGASNIWGESVIVDSSEFNYFRGTLDCEQLRLTNSTFNRAIRVRARDEILISNSRFCPAEGFRMRLFIMGDSHDDRDELLIIEDCLIQGSIQVMELAEIKLQNNTIIVSDDKSYGSEALFLQDIEDVSIRNNIFLCSDSSREAISHYFEVNEDHYYLRYNCIYGFEAIFGNRFRRHNPDYELDDTNVLEDPWLYSLDPLEPYLTWGSPCIDAGDPDSPEDPDGSRADMGAFWFDHRLSTEQDTSFILHPSAFILSSVYPNPFNSHLSIDLDASLPVQVSIYDPLGRVVETGRYNQRQINLNFNDSYLPTGTYFLYINDGRQGHVQRLTLMR